MNYDDYLNKMRKIDTWVDHVAVKGLAEVYKRKVLVYEFDRKLNEYKIYNKIEVDDEEGQFLVSYHNGKHYNSIYRQEICSQNDAIEKLSRNGEKVQGCQCTIQ